jgi:hypothetical protein
MAARRFLHCAPPMRIRAQPTSPFFAARALLTTSVAQEAQNSTAIDVHAFQRNALSSVAQIMVNERAVPTTMQTMQIVQQILFNALQSLTSP